MSRKRIGEFKTGTGEEELLLLLVLVEILESREFRLAVIALASRLGLVS